MTVNLEYEMFIRSAFSRGTGRDVERWGDPAALANTDIYAAGELHEVKGAVAYSMLIYNNLTRNEHTEHPIITNQVNYNRQDTIVQDVLNAPDKSTVLDLIREYKQTFLPIFQ